MYSLKAVPFIGGFKARGRSRIRERTMPREIHWNDAEEIGILLQEEFPNLDPLTVRFTDLHRYVTELEGFADDPAQSNEVKLEAIQMAWHEEYENA
jgi:FeS assembly protein IscX